MTTNQSERGDSRRDQPPELPPPGIDTPQYGVEYAPVWAAYGIPLPQAEPPAGAMGEYYGVRPSCEQLTWLHIPKPVPAWQAVTTTPDHGKQVWFQWVIPYGNPGTRLDAQKALSAGGVCKLEGQTIPLLTHADIAQSFQSLNAGQAMPIPTNWAGLSLIGMGAMLLCFAVLAHHAKGKDKATEDTAQFEAFANAWRKQ